MTIGERIKELRQKNDLTQEKLADYLCVTYQAVSKWECGLTSPDLSLIAPLTKLFHVTADELLGLDNSENAKRAAEIEAAYEKTWKTGDLEERYKIAEKAVAEFPGDMKYLDWFAWTEALRSFEFEDDKTYADEQEKAIKHFRCVIENSVDEEIKASSIQGIVQYLDFRGRSDEARKYAESYPENYPVSKDQVLLTCLHGEEAEALRQKMLDRALLNLVNALHDNRNIFSYETAEKVMKIMIPDENYQYYHDLLWYNFLDKARLFAAEGDAEKTVEALQKAYYHSAEFDRVIDSGVICYTSPFFNKVTWNTSELCGTGTTTYVENFFEALDRNAFDNIRDNEVFAAFVEKIKG